MISTKNRNNIEKKLVNLLIPCGECNYAKDVHINADGIIIIDCWNQGEIRYDSKNEDFECKSKDIKDVCENLLFLKRK